MNVLSEAASQAKPSEGGNEIMDVAAEAYAASREEHKMQQQPLVKSDDDQEEEEDTNSYDTDNEDTDSRNDNHNDDNSNNYNDNVGERFLELDGSNKSFGTVVGQDESDYWVIVFDDSRIISVDERQLIEGITEYKEFLQGPRGRDTFLQHTGPMLDAFYNLKNDGHDSFRIWSRSNMAYHSPPQGNVGMSPDDFDGMKFASDGKVYSITSHRLSMKKSLKGMDNVEFTAHNRNNEKIIISYGDFLLCRKEYIVKFGAPVLSREDVLNQKYPNLDLDAQVESVVTAATEEADTEMVTGAATEANPQPKRRCSKRKSKPTPAAKEQLESKERKRQQHQRSQKQHTTVTNKNSRPEDVGHAASKKEKVLKSMEKKVAVREANIKKQELTLKKQQEALRKERALFKEEKQAFEKEREAFRREKETFRPEKETPTKETPAKETQPSKDRLYELNGVRRNDVWKHIKLVHPDKPLPEGQTQWENKDAVGAYCKLCETEIAGFKSTTQSNSVTTHFNKFHRSPTTTTAPTIPAGVPQPPQYAVATPAAVGVAPQPAAPLNVYPSTTAVTPGYYPPQLQQQPVQQQQQLMMQQQQPMHQTMQQQPPMQQQPYYPPPPHGYYPPAPPPYYNSYPPHYRPY